MINIINNFCLPITHRLLQIRIRFIRQRFNQTLKQTHRLTQYFEYLIRYLLGSIQIYFCLPQPRKPWLVPTIQMIISEIEMLDIQLIFQSFYIENLCYKLSPNQTEIYKNWHCEPGRIFVLTANGTTLQAAVFKFRDIL